MTKVLNLNFSHKSLLCENRSVDSPAIFCNTPPPVDLDLPQVNHLSSANRQNRKKTLKPEFSIFWTNCKLAVSDQGHSLELFVVSGSFVWFHMKHFHLDKKDWIKNCNVWKSIGLHHDCTSVCTHSQKEVVTVGWKCNSWQIEVERLCKLLRIAQSTHRWKSSLTEPTFQDLQRAGGACFLLFVIVLWNSFSPIIFPHLNWFCLFVFCFVFFCGLFLEFQVWRRCPKF